MAEADDPRQQVGRAHVAAGQADAGEEEGEAGGGVATRKSAARASTAPAPAATPCTAAITGNGHSRTARTTWAGHPVEVEEPGGVQGEGGADDLVDVAAGAEAAPLAREHQGAHGPFPGQFGEQVPQVGVGAEGERVELVGAGEGDGGDAVGEVDAQMPPAGGAGGGAGEGTHGGAASSGRRCPTTLFTGTVTVVMSARYAGYP
ncbi:hypothetical protein SGLAM104S_02482 [Streptomyces glaucescens]